jgi:hypothetical protein
MNDASVSRRLRARLAGLPPLSGTGPWLCGGAVLRALTDENGGDLDLFFRDQGQLDTWRLGSPTALCSVEHDRYYQLTDYPHVQLIRDFFPTPEAVLASFDIDVCKCSFDGTTVVASVAARAAAAGNKSASLSATIKHPFSTWKRVFRYAARGYSFQAGDLDRVLSAAGLPDAWNSSPSDRNT